MKYMTETIILAIGALFALLGVAFAEDNLFQAHATVLFFVLLASTVLMMRKVEVIPAGSAAPDTSGYMDDVVRYGVIATLFWGIVGFLAGVVIATQLAFPEVNIEPWFNFGRLRPLHTSALYLPLVAMR